MYIYIYTYVTQLGVFTPTKYITGSVSIEVRVWYWHKLKISHARRNGLALACRYFGFFSPNSMSAMKEAQSASQFATTC